MKTTTHIIPLKIGMYFFFILLGLNVLAQKDIQRGTVMVDGVRLNYVAQGKGTPCLVIGSSVYYPAFFPEQLRKSFRLYFVDMRWFASDNGASPLSDYSIQAIADDIEAVRKALNLNKVIVLGHSIHGNIVLDYCRRYPENVSHVVMVGSPAVWGNQQANELSESLRKQASPERMARLESNWKRMGDSIKLVSPAEAFVMRYVTNGPLYWYDYTYDCSALWKGVPINITVLNHLFQKLYTNYDVAESRLVVNQPVLVMLGKYDYVVPYMAWKKVYTNMPNLSLVYFGKSGHTPQLEEPVEFDRMLMEWIKNN